MENLIPLHPLGTRYGWAVIPGRGRTKTSYIAVRDVAEMARRVLTKPPLNHSVIEFGGEDLSLLDCGDARDAGRENSRFSPAFGCLAICRRALRPFNRALEALLEIVEYVELKGLRADRNFLGEHPISLISFRYFLREQLREPAWPEVWVTDFAMFDHLDLAYNARESE